MKVATSRRLDLPPLEKYERREQMRAVTDDKKDNIPIRLCAFDLYIRLCAFDLYIGDGNFVAGLRRQQTDRKLELGETHIKENQINGIMARPRKRFFLSFLPVTPIFSL